MSGDLLFALSKPVRIVVQKIPAIQAVEPKFVSEQVTAEDYPHEFASVSAPLCGPKHDVARNVVRVLDEPIGKRRCSSSERPRFRSLTRSRTIELRRPTAHSRK